MLITFLSAGSYSNGGVNLTPNTETLSSESNGVNSTETFNNCWLVSSWREPYKPVQIKCGNLRSQAPGGSAKVEHNKQ